MAFASIACWNAPTLSRQSIYPPVSGYFPFAWESAGAYLVYARDGSSLFILRCSLGGSCQRAVTSSARSGITQIAVTQSAFSLEADSH